MIERLLLFLITASRDEEGQTVIEYALILAFVAAVAVVLGAGGTISSAVDGAFDSVVALF